MLDLGAVDISFPTLYFFLIWFAVGVLCTVIPQDRGVWLAGALVIVVQLFRIIFFVNPPGLNLPTFQWFRFGSELDVYFDTVIVPFVAAVAGALIAERFLPEYYEDEE